MLEYIVVFGVFVNEGVKNDIVFVFKVEDLRGEILKEVIEFNGKQVFDQKEVYLFNYIICDFGGYGDRIGGVYIRVKGINFCFKIGIIDGFKDLIMVMYYKNIVVGVWVGNNDNIIMFGVWGVFVLLFIVYSIVNRIVDRYLVEIFICFFGIFFIVVCRDIGGVFVEGVNCEKEVIVYMVGRFFQSDNREVVFICKVNGLIFINLEVVRQYDLVIDKVYINFKLENVL